MKVYGASKLKYASMWKQLREDEPTITWTARWPDIVGTVPDTANEASVFWIADVADVNRSDFVFCFAGDGEEILRGALVEVGVALALGKYVIAIGENPSFGTWQYHPRVFRAGTMQRALWMARFIYG